MSENIITSTPEASVPILADNSASDRNLMPSIAPPHKKFPLLITILLLFLALLATLAIYLFLQVRTLTLDKTAPSPLPTPVSSALNIEDWNTYDNEKYNFSFRYPNEWNLDIPSEIGNGADPDSQVYFTENGEKILSLTMGNQYGDELISKIALIDNGEPQPIILDNLIGSYFRHDLGLEYFINIDGEALQLSYFNQDSRKIDQILTTFKSTDSTTCQHEGKTYKEGESVKLDKCNTCSCTNGQLICTLIACD